MAMGWTGLGVMVFNTIFNNISVISRQSVLMVEDTEVPGENHWPAASHWQTLPSNVSRRHGKVKLVHDILRPDRPDGQQYNAIVHPEL